MERLAPVPSALLAKNGSAGPCPAAPARYTSPYDFGPPGLRRAPLVHRRRVRHGRNILLFSIFLSMPQLLWVATHSLYRAHFRVHHRTIGALGALPSLLFAGQSQCK
jgi:hypothetical protein